MAFVGAPARRPSPGPTSSRGAATRWPTTRCPRVVELVDELPLNATGKVVKDVLRAAWPPGTGPGRRRERPDAPRALLARRPAGRRARGVGGGAGRRRPAGRLGCRRHQGRGADRRSHAQRLRLAGIGGDLPNPAFALDNRGKRSVVLDLRDPADRQHLEELLATADVFISNLRPDALDKLDLEPARRWPATPASSTAASAATGSAVRTATGPPTTSAPSGPAPGLSRPDGRRRRQPAERPGRHRRPHHRAGRPGRHPGRGARAAPDRAGRVVEVSLLRTGAYVLGWDLGLQMTLGKVAGAEPRHRNQSPLMNPYRAADGRWFFFTGLEAERHIGAVCRALGRPDLLEDPRFAERRRPSARTASRSSPSSTRSSPRGPWPSGPNASTAKACGGHRPSRRPRWSRIRSCWPTTGSSRSRAARRAVGQRPGHLLGRRPAGATSPSRLGEHTDEVLGELADRAARRPTGRRRRGAAQSWRFAARASSPRAMTSRWISFVPSPITISGASR